MKYETCENIILTIIHEFFISMHSQTSFVWNISKVVLLIVYCSENLGLNQSPWVDLFYILITYLLDIVLTMQQEIKSLS